MKHFTLTLVAILLLFGCSREYNDITYKKLRQWDTEIWNRNYTPGDTLPRIILDSLSGINSRKLSGNTEAYYNLLYTIVSDKADVAFTDDSVISASVNYYQGTEEYYNYARALLYNGIVKLRINNNDTSIYQPIKQAEAVYHTNQISDKKLLALIYFQLGTYNYDLFFFERSLDYYSKALELYREVGDTYNIYNSYCNIAYTLLPLERFEEAYETLSYFQNLDSIPPYVYTNYLDCMSMYYKSVGDISRSLIYKKKLLEEKELDNILGAYYSISNSYYQIGQKDSCLLYLQKLKQELSHSDTQLKDEYYKVISEMYYGYQFFKEAKECTDSAFAYMANSSNLKIYELEKKYDVLYKDQAIKEIKQHNIVLLIIIILSTIILLVLLVVFVQYRKLKKGEILKKEIENENISLINKILFFSCKTVPEMISMIDKLDNNSKNSLSGNYNEYIRAKKKIENDYKISLRNFMSDEFAQSHYLQPREDSSLQDIIISLLSDNNYSNKDIGSILNISSDAVRAALSRINSKKRN